MHDNRQQWKWRAALPRVADVYAAPAGTTAVPNTTIASTPYNALVADLVADLNLARPILAGGTGSTTAAAARTALGVHTGAITISGSNAGLTIENVDSGAGAKPDFNLYRNSATPAANDIIGRILFTGEDSAGNTETYGIIQGVIVDPTSASEDSKVVVQTAIAGTVATRLNVGAGAWMEGATGTDKGAGTVNASLYDNTYRVGMVFLATGSLTGATVDIVLTTYIAAGYTRFRLDYEGFEPATDNAALILRVSINAGSSFTITGYASVLHQATSAAASFAETTTELFLSGGVGNAAGERASGSANFKIGASYFDLNSIYHCTNPTPAFIQGNAGGYSNADNVDAIRLMPNSGNFDAGTYTLWGIRDS